MPPEAWSGVGATAAATVRTSSGRARPERAPSRSTRWIRVAPARRESRREGDRVACLVDDLVVVATMEADGALAEDVHGRDHLDRRREPVGQIEVR